MFAALIKPNYMSLAFSYDYNDLLMVWDHSHGLG